MELWMVWVMSALILLGPIFQLVPSKAERLKAKTRVWEAQQGLRVRILDKKASKRWIQENLGQKKLANHSSTNEMTSGEILRYRLRLPTISALDDHSALRQQFFAVQTNNGWNATQGNLTIEALNILNQLPSWVLGFEHADNLSWAVAEQTNDLPGIERIASCLKSFTG